MSRKITFLTLFLWLTAVIFPVFAQQKADTTYTFRFVPQKDMFWGSRNLVGITIQLSNSEEKELFIRYSMQISSE